MTTLRGRAATPVRPGITVKAVLMGTVPLSTGETVSEAAIVDLFNAYKELIRRENELRPKIKRLKGMHNRSFYTMFKFAQLLGLVELVRTEPMLFPPPGGNLYRVEKPNGEYGVRVVPSTRKVFKLTDVGREDERSWTNLTQAWKDQWPAPQKVEYVPPRAPPVEAPKPKPSKTPPTGFVPYKWVSVPSARQFKLLFKHLAILEELGIGAPGVEPEVDRLSMQIGDWLLELEDDLEDAIEKEQEATTEKLELWQELITQVMEGLSDRDLAMATGNLQQLVVTL